MLQTLTSSIHAAILESSFIDESKFNNLFIFCNFHNVVLFLSTKNSVDIVNAFVSTRSGLTRFTNPCFSYDFKNRSEHEYNILSRSIEEVYYKRAVEFYSIKNNAFVFSVPFNAYKDNDFLVTASRAIFVGTGKQNAPGKCYYFSGQNCGINWVIHI